jgi:nitrogenase molybdenum-iron protein NifN
MSQPIGAALAFMGLHGTMPLLHGSQGCTAFGLVLFVRHFREAIPLQTTAMSEVATILGGMENVEQALVNIHKRAQPAVVGLCSTGVTEVKGDDMDGFVKLIRAKHPELDTMAVVPVATPDFVGAFQDGWSKAVTRMVEILVEPVDSGAVPQATTARVNVLAGCHLTVADVEEIRQIIEDFGLQPVILPDLSGSLDGHVPEDFTPTTLGGTTLAEIRNMGSAKLTLAIGEQMRAPAQALQTKTGVPYVLLDRLMGLDGNDALMSELARVSGREVPRKYRRQRSQLLDAMLDAHFFFGRKRVAIGAEPDLLWAYGQLLTEMGCELAAAVTTTSSPVLERLAAEEVVIGDLEDLEARATGCDLLITHAHGRQMAQRLGLPLFRTGIPMFDRLGAAHQLNVGYRGTRDRLFELGNILIAHGTDAHGSMAKPEEQQHACAQATARSA